MFPKSLPIDIVVDDIFSPVTARGDVIERVREFDASRTEQDGTCVQGYKDSMGMLRS